jgi:hypothetical protein
MLYINTMKKLALTIIPCAAGLMIASGLTASAQTLALQLQAANYNAANGGWMDSSSIITPDSATYSGPSTPTLVNGVTPNGSAAVLMNGAGVFSLASGISSGSYTAFAYIQPAAGSGPFALFGGTGYGSFEYRIYAGHQDSLLEWLADLGSGSGSVPSTGFSLIDATVSPTGGAYRLNGAADGSTAGTTFTAPIVYVGNNYGVGGGEAFSGYVAEIDIYTGVLTPAQISAIEGNLITEYVTAVPEPTTWSLMAVGFGMLLGARRFRRGRA